MKTQSSSQEQLIEIYDFYQPPLLERPWFIWTVSAVAVAIVVLVIYLIRRARRAPLTPFQKAMQELDGIVVAHLMNKKDIKNAYFQMTRIIKQYLAAQFGYKTLDKTDEELISFLAGAEAPGVVIESLKKIRENTLWVKFAGYDIIKTQAENDLQIAKELVLACDEIVRAAAKAASRKKGK